MGYPYNSAYQQFCSTYSMPRILFALMIFFLATILKPYLQSCIMGNLSDAGGWGAFILFICVPLLTISRIISTVREAGGIILYYKDIVLRIKNRLKKITGYKRDIARAKDDEC